MQSQHSNSTADRSEENSTGSFNPVLLSFGGNLDGTIERFERALRRLSVSGFKVLKVSEPLINPAVGCEPGAGDFTNISVLGEWNGSPLELLDLTQSIEVEEGRPADHPHWVSRTIDIDIILMGFQRLNLPRLKVPHPLASSRDFVLIPSRQVLSEEMMRFLEA
jgi:2-amino-4-hydroxy-6-hydroxymethyldihydropteridine diphosphokinase